MTSYIKSKKFSRNRHNNGLAVLSILIVFSVFCLGIIYLVQTNGLVGCSYQIREQEKHLTELQKENQMLEMEAARLQSPVNLEEAVQKLGMVETGQVVYLEEKAVAKR